MRWHHHSYIRSELVPCVGHVSAAFVLGEGSCGTITPHPCVVRNCLISHCFCGPATNSEKRVSRMTRRRNVVMDAEEHCSTHLSKLASISREHTSCREVAVPSVLSANVERRRWCIACIHEFSSFGTYHALSTSLGFPARLEFSFFDPCNRLRRKYRLEPIKHARRTQGPTARMSACREEDESFGSVQRENSLSGSCHSWEERAAVRTVRFSTRTIRTTLRQWETRNGEETYVRRVELWLLHLQSRFCQRRLLFTFKLVGHTSDCRLRNIYY